MKAVTMLSNKIVSNEVIDKEVLLAILWKKPNEHFGQPNRCLSCEICFFFFFFIVYKDLFHVLK